MFVVEITLGTVAMVRGACVVEITLGTIAMMRGACVVEKGRVGQQSRGS